jgi:hypothetical protein
MSKTFNADGEKHTVKKNKKGDIIVDHAGKKGKYDKINLTKKAGAKTVDEGVKATKKWHSSDKKKKRTPKEEQKRIDQNNKLREKMKTDARMEKSWGKYK